MKEHQAISIVVPTLNEVENIPNLLARIDTSMQAADIMYEVVIIDDHSSDNTRQIAENLSDIYPVHVSLKQGQRGKAYSLLQGFEEAHYPLIAMIDADLQYAPEELTAMHQMLLENDADVVLTRRHEKKTSFIRRLSSQIFNFFFAKLLFGIDYDTQSGLKLFRKKVLRRFTMTPSPWSFDLEFIVRALENKFKIVSHDIVFTERTHGATKVKLLSTTIELAKASLLLRWRTSAHKTREGLRANLRYLEQVAPTAVITLIISCFVVVAGARPASALSLQDLTSGLLSPLTSSSSQTSTPSTTSTTSPIAVSTDTSTASSTTGSNSTTTATPTTSDSTGTSTVSPNSTSTTSSVSVASSSHTGNVVLASADTTKLSAATGSENAGNVYDSGYPHYKLSSASTSTLAQTAHIAMIISAICAGIGILVLTYRQVKQFTTQKLLRS